MQGGFLDCARNDGMGEWVYFTQRTTDMFGKRYSCIVIPTEVEGSFSLAVRRRVFEKEKRETPYRGRAVLSVKGFAQEEGKGLSLLEMRGGYPLKSTKI